MKYRTKCERRTREAYGNIGFPFIFAMKKINKEKIISFGKEALKDITTFGNAVVCGSLGAVVFCAGSLWVPLKICAAVSTTMLTGILTDKTNAYIDKEFDETIKDISELKKLIKNSSGA